MCVMEFSRYMNFDVFSAENAAEKDVSAVLNSLCTCEVRTESLHVCSVLALTLYYVALPAVGLSVIVNGIDRDEWFCERCV